MSEAQLCNCRHCRLFVCAGRGVELTETGHALHDKLAVGVLPTGFTDYGKLISNVPI